MFDKLKEMYKRKKITKNGLKNAVKKEGWITAAQYQEITGEEYE